MPSKLLQQQNEEQDSSEDFGTKSLRRTKAEAKGWSGVSKKRLEGSKSVVKKVDTFERSRKGALLHF